MGPGRECLSCARRVLQCCLFLKSSIEDDAETRRAVRSRSVLLLSNDRNLCNKVLLHVAPVMCGVGMFCLTCISFTGGPGMVVLMLGACQRSLRLFQL